MEIGRRGAGYVLLACALLLTALVLLSCGVLEDSPDTSAPGGVSNSDELWDACMDREMAIFDWRTEKLKVLAKDLIEGRQSLPDVMPEEERINKESERMITDLETNCAERAEEIRQLADRAEQEKKSTSDCDDCLSIRQLNEEYEANSFVAEQKYTRTRHNFGGKVESIGRDVLNPSKPLVRVQADGATLAFRLGKDEDDGWALALSKGDWVKANCLITSIHVTWTSGSYQMVPSLHGCTQAD